MLNITNRELWIGARVVHAASVSQVCSLCRNGDESIEHTFAQCHFAQKLCETAKDIISLSLKTKAQVGPIESIFGPQHQMNPDDRRFWAVIRGHLLWTLWSARALSRHQSAANQSAIPDERLDDIMHLIFLNGLRLHLRVLRYIDNIRQDLWNETAIIISSMLSSRSESLGPAAVENHKPRSVQSVITNFFSIIPNPG
jgi:hypothetical protein